MLSLDYVQGLASFNQLNSQNKLALIVSIIKDNFKSVVYAIEHECYQFGGVLLNNEKDSLNYVKTILDDSGQVFKDFFPKYIEDKLKDIEYPLNKHYGQGGALADKGDKLGVTLYNCFLVYNTNVMTQLNRLKKMCINTQEDNLLKVVKECLTYTRKDIKIIKDRIKQLNIEESVDIIEETFHNA